MNWLRWYHGTVTDPKWRVIAKASGRPLPEVVAVWALVLEHASQNEDRGTLDGFDVESAAAALEIPEEAIEAVLDAMEGRVKRHETLTGWMKRQVKRERVSDHSTERVKRHRERTKTVNNDNDLGDGTPRNARKRPDKSRGEEITTNPTIEREGAKRRRASAIPNDWVPNEGHREIAAEEGVDLNAQVTLMRDWAKGNGATKLDWDATFRNWLRNAKRMNGASHVRPSGGSPAISPGGHSGRPALAAGQGRHVVE